MNDPTPLQEADGWTEARERGRAVDRTVKASQDNPANAQNERPSIMPGGSCV